MGTQTHLKDSSQDCQGTRDLHSECIPFIVVHCPISAVAHEVAVWAQPLRHTPNHDADHSERT